MRQALVSHGHPEANADSRAARLHLYAVDPDRPRAFRRHRQATFVVAIVELGHEPLDVLKAGYPYLVRTLANLCVLVVPRQGGRVAHVITLEQGCYALPAAGDGRPDAEALYDHVAPLALSHLVIDNELLPDLPRELWDGDDITKQLRDAGRQLDALGLLPEPFPLADLLTARDRRHVELLFGIGGLSYGNLSARHDRSSFWMSASGVNKARVGKDVVLVTGLDRRRAALQVMVPSASERPGRASIDAIEHWVIYERHAGVGAIVHVHGWMDGVVATPVNYPCGTIELASAVAALVGDAPDLTRAAVGLKNHGLTITGPNLEEILGRIEGRVQDHVPMAA